MAINEEANTRKLYVLPKDLVRRIGNFRRRTGMKSEGEAVRTLLSYALSAFEPASEFFERIAEAINDGWPSHRVVTEIIQKNGMVVQYSVAHGVLTVALSDGSGARFAVDHLREEIIAEKSEQPLSSVFSVPVEALTRPLGPMPTDIPPAIPGKRPDPNPWRGKRTKA